MSAATAASGLQAALGAVKQEVARGGEKEAAPAADAELPAQPDGDRPSLSVSPPKDPPVSILGLQKQYQELEKQYDVLLAHEEYMQVEVLDGEAAPHTISGVDFARPLAPLPNDIPLDTGSDANKFAMLVWRMLDACESGGIGGDASRLSGVLAAAVEDVLAFQSMRGGVGPLFHHLLGCTLAVSNNGVRSWIMRGEKDLGDQVFKLLGTAWKKVFALPEDTLAAVGISAALRKLAIDACEGLRKYLRSFGSKDYEGTYANVFTFSYIVKPRAKRPAAPAAAAAAGAAKRSKTAQGAAAAAAPPNDAQGQEELGQLKAIISQRLTTAAKRAVHSERNKPTTTIEVPVASNALAGLLFGDSVRHATLWLLLLAAESRR